MQKNREKCKRSLAVLLVLVMVLAMLPMSVLAASVSATKIKISKIGFEADAAAANTATGRTDCDVNTMYAKITTDGAYWLDVVDEDGGLVNTGLVDRNGAHTICFTFNTYNVGSPSILPIAEGTYTFNAYNVVDDAKGEELLATAKASLVEENGVYKSVTTTATISELGFKADATAANIATGRDDCDVNTMYARITTDGAYWLDVFDEEGRLVNEGQVDRNGAHTICFTFNTLNPGSPSLIPIAEGTYTFKAYSEKNGDLLATSKITLLNNGGTYSAATMATSASINTLGFEADADKANAATGRTDCDVDTMYAKITTDGAYWLEIRNAADGLVNKGFVPAGAHTICFTFNTSNPGSPSILPIAEGTYTFNVYDGSDADKTLLTSSKITLVKDGDTYRVATYSSSPSVVNYTITATAGAGGSVTPASASVKKGEDHLVAINPNPGYVIADVLVDGVSVGAVSTYVFTDVQKNHTLSATFEAGIVSDVNTSAWYYKAVKFVLDNDIMEGTSATAFSPNSNLSRSMMVQILYNLEGKPSAGDAGFDDVSSGIWYANAIAWAAKNNIVSGVGNDLFAPNQNVTREQMALILFNYCTYKGIKLPTPKDAAYTDANSVSAWAAEAVQAMYKAGILTGKSTGVFDPQGTATRAEVAQMMMSFVETTK